MQRHLAVYVLKSVDGRPLRTYTGSTVHVEHRLRQHNGEIKGGARSTRGRKWAVWLQVTGFTQWGDCLSFEHALKSAFKRARGSNRRYIVQCMCQSDTWCPLGLELACDNSVPSVPPSEDAACRASGGSVICDLPAWT